MRGFYNLERCPDSYRDQKPVPSLACRFDSGSGYIGSNALIPWTSFTGFMALLI
jgi:hypothetical protein